MNPVETFCKRDEKLTFDLILVLTLIRGQKRPEGLAPGAIIYIKKFDLFFIIKKAITQ